MRKAVWLCFLLSASTLWAGTYPGIRDGGDPVAGTGARSVAMGSTGLAGDFFRNPAVAPEGRGGVRFGAGPVFLTEKSAETTATRFNDNGRFEITQLGVSWAGEKAWMGLSAAPAADFHYNDVVTLYDNTGLPASRSELKDAGALWGFAPGAGFRWGAASFGVSVDMWTGRESLSARRYDFGTGTTLSLREDARYTGLVARVGAAVRLGEKARAGFAFRPPSRLRRSYDLSSAAAPLSNAGTAASAAAPARGRSGADRWTTPPSWGLGFVYRAPGDFPTTLAAEVEQTFWPRFRRNGKRVDGTDQTKPLFEELAAQAELFGGGAPAPRRFHDVTEIRLGVEHALSADWSLRYGFRHAPAAYDPGVEGTFFALGAGWRASPRWRLSLAGEWGKRDYVGDGVFFPAAHRRDETFRRLLIGVEAGW